MTYALVGLIGFALGVWLGPWLFEKFVEDDDFRHLN